MRKVRFQELRAWTVCLTALAQAVKSELPLATMTVCCGPLLGAQGFCVGTVEKTGWRVTAPVLQVRQGFLEQEVLIYPHGAGTGQLQDVSSGGQC